MISTQYRRMQGINERQDVEVHFSAVLDDIPCDGNRHYGSIIASGLTVPQSWGNKINVTGIRCTAVDSDGLIQSLGTACINLNLFSQRVGNDSEYHRSKVSIAFDDYNGVANSTDHDEIDTRGGFNEILVNDDQDDIVNYAVSVTGTGSGVTSTSVVLAMKGTVVF